MDFCRGPVPFFGQRSNNSVRMISPTTVGFPPRRLWILTLLVILLSSVTVASSFSLTNTFHRLLQDADDELQARELTLQYCGDAIEQGGDNNEKTKSAFSKYIYRGDPVSNILLYGLTSLGGDQWKDILLESKNIERTSDEKFVFPDDLGTTLSIVYIVFICIALILLIIACVMFPTCCSSCWRNCFGKCFCRKCCHDRERVRPIQEVSKKKRRLLLGGSLAGVTFFIIFACLAIAFSTKFAWSLPGSVCQVARFSAEVTSGVLYDQHPGESSWMEGLPEGSEFGGFDAARAYVQRIKSTFIDTTAGQENIINKLDGAITAVEADLTTVLDETKSAIGDVPTFIDTEQVYRPAASLLTANEDELKAMLDQGQTEVNSNAKKAQEQLEKSKTQLEGPINEVESAINDAEKEVQTLRKDFVRILDENRSLVVYLSDLSFIPFLVISILSLTGIVFVLIMVVKLQNHRKRGTEPKHKTYSGWFAFFWGWFAITGVVLFFLGFTILIVLSVSDSGCEVVKDGVKDPSTLNQYKLTENFYPDDPEDDIRKLVDSCIAQEGDGEFLDVYAGKQIDEAHKAVGEARDQFEKVKDQPENKEEYRPLLNSLGKLGSTIMVNPGGQDLDPNAVFISRTILLGGSQKNVIEITDDEEDLKSFLDALVTAANKILKSFKSTWPEFENDKKIYSLQDHLNEVERTGKVFGCDAVFCIELKDGATVKEEICSTSTSGDKVIVGDTEFTRSPQYDGTNTFKHNMKTGLLTTLQGKGCDPDLMTPSSEQQNFEKNTFLMGLYIAGKKSEMYAKDNEKAEPNIETVSLMLKGFEDATDEAVLTANNALDDGEGVLDDAGDGLNCKAMAYSVGSVIDGFCGGVQQDLFWIALCWCLMACVSFFFWVICYKLFHYFKDRANAEKTDEPAAVSSSPKGSPSSLMAFAKQGDAKEVDKQMQYIDPNTVLDDNYNTTLHCAAFSGDTETVQKLLDKEALINERNDFGYTPMGVAASEGHADVVSLLVQRGADPTIQDEFGETALHAAARAGDLPVVEALCQDCAPQPTYLNDEGIVAADIALIHDKVEVEHFLDIKTPKYVKRITKKPSFGLSPSSSVIHETPTKGTEAATSDEDS